MPNNPNQSLNLSIQIPPYYRDLFAAMTHDDSSISDSAFDKVMFERGQAVPYICAQYYNSQSRTPKARKLRYYCIQLLSFSESSEAIPTILDALNDEYPLVRKEACYAVEDHKIIDALPQIRKRLQDMSPEVRHVAQEVYDFLLRS